MDCRSCGKHINDHSKYCPHCGVEQEDSFCVNCGTAVNTKSSKKGGMVLFIVVLAAAGLLFWSMQSGQQIGKVELTPATPTQAPPPNLFQRAADYIFTSAEPQTEEKDYSVLFSTSIDFGTNKTHEIYLLVKEGESKRNQVEFAKAEIRSRPEYAAQDVVILYTCSDPDCRDNGQFLGEFVSVDTKLNPTYKLEDGLQPLTDSLFLKWRDDV
jgi:hypothetical protein